MRALGKLRQGLGEECMCGGVLSLCDLLATQPSGLYDLQAREKIYQKIKWIAPEE